MTFYIFIKSPDDFPNVGKLEQLINYGIDSEQRAVEKWNILMRKIDDGERIEDKIVLKAMRSLGGMPAFQKMDVVRDLPHVRREFIKYVKSQIEQHDRQDVIAEIDDKKLLGGE